MSHSHNVFNLHAQVRDREKGVFIDPEIIYES